MVYICLPRNDSVHQCYTEIIHFNPREHAGFLSRSLHGLWKMSISTNFWQPQYPSTAIKLAGSPEVRTYLDVCQSPNGALCHLGLHIWAIWESCVWHLSREKTLISFMSRKKKKWLLQWVECRVCTGSQHLMAWIKRTVFKRKYPP